MRRIGLAALFVSLALVASGSDTRKPATSWAADNGNGTYSNPLFYDEFSDPDLIRVGSDYYLTGTTMHTMPGLPILHSRDMVNWRIIAYAFDRLDLGPDFRLEGGRLRRSARSGLRPETQGSRQNGQWPYK
jgi:xylan 1,4-beta-xylosidase